MKDQELSLQIVNPHAAGIDVGSRNHFIAVDQNHEHVRKFGVYTKDHQDIIDYLHAYHVTTVAMESTGSYWQTLFNALQQAKFEVILVNGSQIKNVKGRKTDILDCMWIQRLHSLGLLSASFILSEYQQQLRTLYSHRQHLIEQASKYTNKMQKALRLMNVRLDVAVNDITGKSGMNIIKAILNGVYDPHALAQLADRGVKKSKEEIALSLHGAYRDDLIFELRSCLQLFEFYEQAIVQCDQQLATFLHHHAPQEQQQQSLPELHTKGASMRMFKHRPAFNVQQIAYVYFKTDLYQIPGVSHTTVLCLLTNMGTDIYKFPSAKQFAAWLRLVPNNKISGGKIISTRTPSGKNLIAHSLRQAANTIGNLKNHPLTPFFKRIAYRKGRMAAITATARKLAIIIYNMIVHRQDYRYFDYENVNIKNKSRLIKNISTRISKLQLTPDELKTLFQRTSLSTT